MADHDEWILKQIERSMAMRRHTEDYVLNRYWDFAEEITQTGFVPFVIKGGIAWESTPGVKFHSADGMTWLESGYDDLDLVKLQSNAHEIWGGRKISLDLANVEDSRARLEEAIEEIALVSNSLSLLTGASITWHPARYLKVQVGGHDVPAQTNSVDGMRQEWRFIPLARHWEEQTAAVMKDADVREGVFPFIAALKSVQNEKARGVIKTAVNWHAQAGIFSSGLNRFLNYWASIELVCHFFHDRVPREAAGRLTRKERNEKLVKLMSQPITSDNCIAIARECAELVNPTARTKMANVLGLLYSGDGGEYMRRALFDADPAMGRSMYSIRNDIAHGNRSEYDRDFVLEVDKRLRTIQELSREVIIASLNKADSLLKTG